MFKIIVISLFVSVYGEEATLGIETDYSVIAEDAERNKDDILNFLNQSKVKEKYKTMYQSLLEKLLKDGKDVSRRGSTRRIVSGRNTSISAVPWQVSLREKTYPICGGSVITGLWCLTAAHCLLRYAYRRGSNALSTMFFSENI